MHVLFVHSNYPAQFRYLAPRLAKDLGWRCTFVTRNKTAAELPRVERVLYRKPGGATAANHPCTRYFEGAVRDAHGVYEALKARPDIKPDVVVAHSGFGSSLFLPHLDDAPVVNFFEYYYHADGGAFRFRPEFPVTEADVLRSGPNNAMILLDLQRCDRGWCPNFAQRDVMPGEFHHKIEVIPEGVDTALYCRKSEIRNSKSETNPNGENPNGGNGERVLPDGTVVPRGTRIVTYVSRGFELMRGFDVFMEAARRIYEAYPDVVFVVAGTDRACYLSDGKLTGGVPLRRARRCAGSGRATRRRRSAGSRGSGRAAPSCGRCSTTGIMGAVRDVLQSATRRSTRGRSGGRCSGAPRNCWATACASTVRPTWKGSLCSGGSQLQIGERIRRQRPHAVELQARAGTAGDALEQLVELGQRRAGDEQGGAEDRRVGAGVVEPGLADGGGEGADDRLGLAVAPHPQGGGDALAEFDLGVEGAGRARHRGGEVGGLGDDLLEGLLLGPRDLERHLDGVVEALEVGGERGVLRLEEAGGEEVGAGEDEAEGGGEERAAEGDEAVEHVGVGLHVAAEGADAVGGADGRGVDAGDQGGEVLEDDGGDVARRVADAGGE
jgi:hypothetical protein